MMYAKLALENVKKSTKDYLIYIVTLTACTSSFSVSRYVTICCNLDICYLLSTPLFWQKMRENAREKGKRIGKKNPNNLVEFF